MHTYFVILSCLIVHVFSRHNNIFTDIDSDISAVLFSSTQYRDTLSVLTSSDCVQLPPSNISSIYVSIGRVVYLYYDNNCRLMLAKSFHSLPIIGYLTPPILSANSDASMEKSSGVIIYDGTHFTGHSTGLLPGSYSANDIPFRIVSLEVINGYSAKFFTSSLSKIPIATFDTFIADLNDEALSNLDLHLTISTICSNGCVHGICLLPDVCECESLYTGISCDNHNIDSSSSLECSSPSASHYTIFANFWYECVLIPRFKGRAVKTRIESFRMRSDPSIMVETSGTDSNIITIRFLSSRVNNMITPIRLFTNDLTPIIVPSFTIIALPIKFKLICDNKDIRFLRQQPIFCKISFPGVDLSTEIVNRLGFRLVNDNSYSMTNLYFVDDHINFTIKPIHSFLKLTSNSSFMFNDIAVFRILSDTDIYLNLTIFRPSTRDLFSQAKIAMYNGDLVLASKILTQLLITNPSSGVYRASIELRARLFEILGHFQLALTDINAFANSGGSTNINVKDIRKRLKHSLSRVEVAKNFYSNGEYFKAAKEYEMILKSAHGSLHFLLLYSECLVHLNDYAMAKHRLYSVLSRDSRNIRAIYLLALVEYRLAGNTAAALSILDTCLRIDSDNEACSFLNLKISKLSIIISEADKAHENGDLVFAIDRYLYALDNEPTGEVRVYISKKLCLLYNEANLTGKSELSSRVLACSIAIKAAEIAELPLFDLLFSRIMGYIHLEEFENAKQDIAKVESKAPNHAALLSIRIFLLSKEKKEDFDPYEVLEVPKDVTLAQLRAVYKKKVLYWHPDKHKEEDRKIAEEKFLEIVLAYEAILANLEKGGDKSSNQDDEDDDTSRFSHRQEKDFKFNIDEDDLMNARIHKRDTVKATFVNENGEIETIELEWDGDDNFIWIDENRGRSKTLKITSTDPLKKHCCIIS